MSRKWKNREKGQRRLMNGVVRRREVVVGGRMLERCHGEERSFFVQIFSHFIPEQMRSRRMLSILYLHFELELSVWYQPLLLLTAVRQWDRERQRGSAAAWSFFSHLQHHPLLRPSVLSSSLGFGLLTHLCQDLYQYQHRICHWLWGSQDVIFY